MKGLLLKRDIKYILTLLLAFTICYADYLELSVKNASLATSAIAYPLDASSFIYNPAFASNFNNAVLSLGYRQPTIGIDNKAQQGFFSYGRLIGWNHGIAIYLSNSKLHTFGQVRFSGIYSYKFKEFDLGISFGFYQRYFDLPLDDPVNKNSKVAPTVSAGILWRPIKKLRLGLSALDINSPNMSIENNIDSKIPFKVYVGVNYALSDYFLPSIALSAKSFTIGGETNPIIHIGAFGKLYYRFLTWRAGINSTRFAAGLGLNIGGFLNGMELDYAMEIPTEKDLKDAGLLAHSFGLTIRGFSQRIPIPDIVLIQVVLMDKPIEGKMNKILAQITNTGRYTMHAFPITFGIYDRNKWKKIFPTTIVDSLAPGQIIQISKNWKPKSYGEYIIRVCANDEGSSLPEISPAKEEKNLDNNCKEFTVIVSKRTFNISIEPEVANLSATKIIVKVEEEPLVPVIFFSLNDSMVDTNGIKLIDEYSKRLKLNSDARLVVCGFATRNELNALDLANSRSRMVLREFEKRGVIDQIETLDEYDKNRPRIVSQVKETDIRFEEENRRVEFDVKLSKKPKMLDAFAEMLKNNPEFRLIIMSSSEDKDDLRNADSLKSAFINENPELRMRVIADYGYSPQINWIIDPDGILFRPRDKYPFSQSWKDIKPYENKILIGGIEEDFESWIIEIVDIENKLAYPLADGTGKPPEQIEWGWKIDTKNLIAPRIHYKLRLTLTDIYKITRIIESKKTITLSPREQLDATENMLIVEFVFDESEPLSKYLERRLFNFAKLFVARVDSGYKQCAEIQGHTDDIGTFKRNRELSTQRAKREYEILRKFIAYFAQVDESLLHKWLENNNCELDFKGYSYERPYKLKDLILGDNSSPYGRSINRRVMLEYKYKK